MEELVEVFFVKLHCFAKCSYMCNLAEAYFFFFTCTGRFTPRVSTWVISCFEGLKSRFVKLLNLMIDNHTLQIFYSF